MAGAGGTLDTVTMSPEGAGTLAQLSALSNLVHLSPVPLAAAAVVPGWPGCHGSLVRANHLPGPSVAAVTQSRGVTQSLQPTLDLVIIMHYSILIYTKITFVLIQRFLNLKQQLMIMMMEWI